MKRVSYRVFQRNDVVTQAELCNDYKDSLRKGEVGLVLETHPPDLLSDSQWAQVRVGGSVREMFLWPRFKETVSR